MKSVESLLKENDKFIANVLTEDSCSTLIEALDVMVDESPADFIPIVRRRNIIGYYKTSDNDELSKILLANKRKFDRKNKDTHIIYAFGIEHVADTCMKVEFEQGLRNGKITRYTLQKLITAKAKRASELMLDANKRRRARELSSKSIITSLEYKLNKENDNE